MTTNQWACTKCGATENKAARRATCKPCEAARRRESREKGKVYPRTKQPEQFGESKTWLSLPIRRSNA